MSFSFRNDGNKGVWKEDYTYRLPKAPWSGKKHPADVISYARYSIRKFCFGYERFTSKYLHLATAM